MILYSNIKLDNIAVEDKDLKFNFTTKLQFNMALIWLPNLPLVAKGKVR